MRKFPTIRADYPDVDVIRVGDTYYMLSTTMHFFPGGVILRSHDLIHWETAGHVYDIMETTPARRLEEGSIYSQGMWAPSLRYHDGVFHAVFAANDTHKTYHYTAEKIEGPWTSHPIEGFYHDSSVLFDDDGRVYIASGNRHIRLVEMEPDLSRPKPGGLDRIIAGDTARGLGYEGSHLYHIGEKYVLFLIHWPAGHMRTEAVWCADSLDGEWTGGDVLEDDMGFFRQGVAQGGIVDTPAGDWYAVLFQDHGAAGRMPVVMPIARENGFPKFSSPSLDFETENLRPGAVLRPLWGDDDFTSPVPAPEWEWNHEPDLENVRFGNGALRLTSSRVDGEITEARNTLTRRTFDPGCAAEITVCGTDLKDGDTAGLCALQGLYAWAGLRKENGSYFLVMGEKTDEGFREAEKIPAEGPAARFRAVYDFRDLKDTVAFCAETGDGWRPLGPVHKLVYRLDHFAGVRIGLFLMSGKEAGGSAEFTRFSMTVDED